MRKILCAPHEDGKSGGSVSAPLVERQVKRLESVRILALFYSLKSAGSSVSCASLASLLKQTLKIKDENFKSEPCDNLGAILQKKDYQGYDIVIIIINSGTVEQFSDAMEHIKRQNAQAYVVFVSTVEYLEMAGPDLLVKSNDLNGIKVRMEEMLTKTPIQPVPSES